MFDSGQPAESDPGEAERRGGTELLPVAVLERSDAFQHLVRIVLVSVSSLVLTFLMTDGVGVSMNAKKRGDWRYRSCV